MFVHEQFKPYKLSIEFLVISMQLLDRLPKGNAHLRDQLKRASTSIPLNLAEGSGKMTNPDKLRFYAIARGSAMECAASCDVISHFEPQLSSQADRGKKLYFRTLKMPVFPEAFSVSESIPPERQSIYPQQKTQR